MIWVIEVVTEASPRTRPTFTARCRKPFDVFHGKKAPTSVRAAMRLKKTPAHVDVERGHLDPEALRGFPTLKHPVHLTKSILT